MCLLFICPMVFGHFLLAMFGLFVCFRLPPTVCFLHFVMFCCFFVLKWGFMLTVHFGAEPKSVTTCHVFRLFCCMIGKAPKMGKCMRHPRMSANTWSIFIRGAHSRVQKYGPFDSRRAQGTQTLRHSISFDWSTEKQSESRCFGFVYQACSDRGNSHAAIHECQRTSPS